jgi:hypothetical protein
MVHLGELHASLQHRTHVRDITICINPRLATVPATSHEVWHHYFLYFLRLIPPKGQESDDRNLTGSV